MRNAGLLLSLSFGLIASLPMRAQEPPPADATHAPAPPKPDESGVYRIGNGVSAPKPVSMQDPEFSRNERKEKLSGACKLSLIVDADGKVTDVRVVRSIAEGYPAKLRSTALSMDEKAIEAVRRYRFKPAILDGQPVPVSMTVEVNFQIF